MNLIFKKSDSKLRGSCLLEKYAPNGRIVIPLKNLKELLEKSHIIIRMLKDASDNGDIDKLEFIILMFEQAEFLFGPMGPNQETSIRNLCVKISSENSIEFIKIFLEFMKDFYIDKYTFILRFVYTNKSSILKIPCVMELAMLYFGLGFINSQAVNDVLFQEGEKETFLQEYGYNISDEKIPEQIYNYISSEMFLTLPYVESLYESKNFKCVPLHYLYDLLNRLSNPLTMKNDLSFLIFRWDNIFRVPFDHLLLLKMIIKVSNEKRNNILLVYLSEMLDMSEVFDNTDIEETMSCHIPYDMTYDEMRSLFTTTRKVKRQRCY